MSNPTELASSAASALLSMNPATTAGIGIATAAVVGVAAVGVGIGVAYYEFEKHKEKEALEEAKTIQNLHQEYFCDIKIPGVSERKNLPAFFIIDEKKAQPQVLLPEKVIESFENPAGNVSDAFILGFRQKVKSTSIKYRAYYKERVAKYGKADITACTLLNLIFILETYVINFQGREYDVEIVERLVTFTTQWVSPRGENSQHATHMREPLEYLKEASHILTDHKTLFYSKAGKSSVSLDETIKNLLTPCVNEGINGIKTFLKFTTKNDDWKLIEDVTMEELALGVLREKMTKSRIFGIPTMSEGEKDVPDSIFEKCVEYLAHYYLQVMKQQLPQNNKISLEQIFMLGDRNSNGNKKNNEHDLKQIRKVFKNSKNFFTQEIEEDNTKKVPTRKLVTITNDADLLKKVDQLHEFALLIERIISLIQLCGKLIDNGKWLGELDEESSDDDYNKTFYLLEQMGKQIERNITSIEETIKKVTKASEGCLTGVQQLFPTEVKNQLKSMQVIPKLVKEVMQCRETFAKHLSQQHQSSEDARKVVRNDLMKTVNSLAKSNHITLPTSVIRAAKMVDENTQTDSIPPVNSAPVIAPIKEIPPVDNAISPVLIIQPGAPEIVPAEENVNPPTLLTEIKNRIETIKADEKPLDQSEINAYEKLWKALSEMQRQSQSIQNERNKCKDRSDKAQAVTTLFTTLCEQIKIFLNLNRDNRIHHAGQFYDDISGELAKPGNRFYLDMHKRNISKFFMDTNTRKIANQVESTCSEVVLVLCSKKEMMTVS